jgi:hypothetical protein
MARALAAGIFADFPEKPLPLPKSRRAKPVQE